MQSPASESQFEQIKPWKLTDMEKRTSHAGGTSSCPTSVRVGKVLVK